MKASVHTLAEAAHPVLPQDFGDVVVFCMQSIIKSRSTPENERKSEKTGACWI